MITASVGVLLAVLGSGPGPVETPVEPPIEPRVRWEAPPGCGTADELRERVTRQLGMLEAGIEIVGRVRRSEGLHVLELELVVGGERQQRSFSAVECHTLLDAAVIVSSAALGPSAADEAAEGPGRAVGPEPVVPEPAEVPAPPATTVREAAPGPASSGRTSTSVRGAMAGPAGAQEGASGLERAPSSPGPAAATTREPTPTAATPRAGRPGQWLVSARGGLGYDGTLAAPLGSLGLGRGWPRWRAQLLLDAFGGRADGPRGRLDLRVVTASPRVCATVRTHTAARTRTAIELSPCAGVGLGLAVGHGRDVPNARTAVVPWLAANLDFGVRVVPRPWLAVGLELSNYALLGRPLFVLSDQRTVYRAGAAGSRALLTVELRFSATDPAGAGH